MVNESINNLTTTAVTTVEFLFPPFLPALADGIVVCREIWVIGATGSATHF